MKPHPDLIAALVAATREPASTMHFTPVKLRARIDGWSPERQRLYVAGIAATGRADRAAALCHASPQTAARLRHRPDAASFARACSAAFIFARQFQRAAAARRAGQHVAARRFAAELKGSKVRPDFSPLGPEPSSPEEPSGRTR